MIGYFFITACLCYNQTVKSEVKMKKKLYIISGLLLLLVMGTLSISYLYKNKKVEKQTEPGNNQSIGKIVKNDFRYLIQEETGIIKDKENDYIIYNSNENYSETVLDKIDIQKLLGNKGEMDEYLKFFFWAFNEQSRDSFSEDEIAIVVSLTLSAYGPNTSAYVKEMAKRYFGILDYELPIGTYELTNYGNYSILKENDYYIRSSVEESTNSTLENTSRELIDIKIDGNKITVYYDYLKGNPMNGVCYFENASDEEREKCVIGHYVIELTYNANNDTLLFNKIKYTKKQ